MKIVIDYKEPLDEDKDYSKRKHNPKMPWIVFIGKSYHDQKGKPSLIGNVNRLLSNGRTLPISNDNGRPFGGGSNEPSRSEPLRGSNSGHLGDQNLKSYIIRVVGPWIKPTWNLWYLSNGMSHSTCTHCGWVDSWLLVVESQIASLTLGLSFCHNLCYICPNGSCKPIFDIYTLIAF